MTLLSCDTPLTLTSSSEISLWLREFCNSLLLLTKQSMDHIKYSGSFLVTSYILDNNNTVKFH